MDCLSETSAFYLSEARVTGLIGCQVTACDKEVGVIYPPNVSVSKGWNSLPYLFVNEQYLWKEDNVSSKYLLRTEENAETHIDYILTFIKSAKLMK